jgi:hypothetical protein
MIVRAGMAGSATYPGWGSAPGAAPDLAGEHQNAAPEGGAGGLALWLSDGPLAGDQVIEEADVQVFVQPGAAPALDKALDAQVNQDGEVSFLLQRQA